MTDEGHTLELLPVAPRVPVRINGQAGMTEARWRPGWSRENVALTPAFILEAVREAFGVQAFGTDPCTEPDNPTRAEVYYALPVNGMAQAWEVEPIWCNPPYGAAALTWAIRCIELGQAGRRVALLVPATTETRTGQAVIGGAELVTFIRGRPEFVATRRPDGKPFALLGGSMLATWNASAIAPLQELGPTVRVIR